MIKALKYDNVAKSFDISAIRFECNYLDSLT